MHAAYTTFNMCMGISSHSTILQLNRMINMVISSRLAGITTTSWSTQAGPTRVRSKRLAKFPAKYRTPARSR